MTSESLYATADRYSAEANRWQDEARKTNNVDHWHNYVSLHRSALSLAEMFREWAREEEVREASNPSNTAQ